MEKPFTATDIIKRAEESRRRRAATDDAFHRWQQSMLQPYLDRVEAIMKTHGLYPEKPEQMQGADSS